ncbi:MAG: MBL fold metallo-hydrolase [Candidatus Sumerlaeota bacterium]|nr:MBL fold metallo-hydrolase [Candidatus Sumerlaeota bacterium]
MEPNPAKRIESAGAGPRDAQPNRLRQIVPGVWFREGEMELSHSNNVVIEMNDYLIVVDANYPSGARAVINDVKKVSSKPIKYVINTHADTDHTYGNPIFTKMGAITIGHATVLEEMNRYEPQNWRRVAGYRNDVAELNLPGPERPQMTFTESPYVISDASRRVELHHLPWGHTRGDIFVYLPNEKVLCTGDAVVNGPYSDPNRAYMGNWANEIRAGLKFDVEHVLPGHGAPAGKELLERQAQFFEELYQAVLAAVKEGKTLDQVVTIKNNRAISTVIRLSKSMQDAFVFPDVPGLKLWQISRFPTQVKNAYMEIAQGKPYGEIVGGK